MEVSFSKRYDYGAARDIEVEIDILAGSKEIRIRAKVDTGSTFCIFQRELGEQLGLTIEDGRFEKVRTAGGAVFEVYGHEVTMQCLGWNIDSTVYFAKETTFQKNVVGQRGWLDKFKLGLIHHDCLLLLSHYDD